MTSSFVCREPTPKRSPAKSDPSEKVPVLNGVEPNTCWRCERHLSNSIESSLLSLLDDLTLDNRLLTDYVPYTTMVVGKARSIDLTELKYSVPKQAELVFYEGILNNPLISKYLPSGSKQIASKIHFTGKNKPTLPVNWRFAESASALHALEASLIGLLLEKKYKVEAPEVEIDV